FFARLWCEREFAAHGLNSRVAQINVGRSTKRGTIRGLHYQLAPSQEAKTVRCTQGAMYDAIVDLRPDSPTYRRWFGLELTADNGRAVCIPAGCAHGYQTLSDDADLLYLVSAPYSPDHQRGVRWDDPAFRIDWPLGKPAVIHPR